MKTLTWTAADAKRAEKMGWRLDTGLIVNKTGGHYINNYTLHAIYNGPFNSDDEAIEFVYREADSGYDGGNVCEEMKTCRKAILLCCGAKKGNL